MPTASPGGDAGPGASALDAAAAAVALEGIHDAVYVLDRDWRFAYLNAAAERMFGTGRDRLVGRVAWDAFPEAVGSAFDREYETAMEQRVPRAFTACLPTWGRWYEEAVYPTADGITVLSRDVTDRRELEQRLRQAEKLRAIGQLAGGVAHDFNNLLTGIQGFTELAEQTAAQGEDPTPMLTEVQRLSQRGADLVQQLLAFGRRGEQHPAPIEVASVLADLQPLLRRLLSERIELACEAPEDLPSVHADRAQLEQVLVNLAVNAGEAMPNGGTVRISGSEAREGSWVEIAVVDTGHGMDPDTAERACEPFFTTKAEGHGHGLGMATVYGIVEEAGGRIDVDSALGEGTTVRVHLPMAATAPPSSDDEPAPTVASVRARPSTVLVLEDDAAIREVVTVGLERAGHHVLAVGDAPPALEILHARDDVRLVISGLALHEPHELVDALRRLRPGLSVLLIGVTSGPLLDGPHVAWLAKPFRLDDLLKQVRSLLEDA